MVSSFSRSQAGTCPTTNLNGSQLGRLEMVKTMTPGLGLQFTLTTSLPTSI